MKKKKKSVKLAKLAAAESVPFDAEKVINIAHAKQLEPEAKVKEVVTVEIDAFKPVVGVRKRIAWRRWQENLDKILAQGNVVTIKKEDGTTETISAEIKKEAKEAKETKEKLRKKLVAKAEKKKKRTEALHKRIRETKAIDDPEEDFDAFIEIAVSCTWYQLLSFCRRIFLLAKLCFRE